MNTKQTYRPIKMIISGGGTGGHLFPAIAIAQKLMELSPQSEVLFVGANGKIEMEKVPKYGFKIEGLNIAGFQRKNLLKNLSLPFKLLGSLKKSKQLINSFKPDIAVGVGGYASGPLVYVAGNNNVPTLLQEQNSFPGITNKILAKKAHKICVAFPNMDHFFDANKIAFTGNPIRQNIANCTRENALKSFGFKNNKPTILIIGGSLGAGSINNAIQNKFQELLDSQVQVIWQTGKYYIKNIVAKCGNKGKDRIVIKDFIEDMASAYAAADLVISRAGALSISEITYLNKASILVPSPNVAEDHQTKNANALTQLKATVLVKDNEADEQLVIQALSLVQDSKRLKELAENTKQIAKYHASEDIINEIYKIIA